MMRCDQYIGLTEVALTFLRENRKPFFEEPEIVGHFEGMYFNKYPLHRYFLKDEHYADEYLQVAPWSSGPMFFIGLKVFNKNGENIITFNWSLEEINAY